jgi:hypothetical protein
MKRLVAMGSVVAAACILTAATQQGRAQAPGVGGSPRTAAVGSKSSAALVNPPNFNYQVSFRTDYQVRRTPPGFTSGISAWTHVKTRWQSDGRGGVTVTLDIDRRGSWVLDWVFNPQSIGQTAGDVAALLAHEQVHFDLSALAVREFLNQAQGRTGAQQQALWASFYGPSGRVQRLDNLYEANTQLGLNRANQDRWVQQIGMLKSRPDGTFTQLEQWAQGLRSPAVRPISTSPKR